MLGIAFMSRQRAVRGFGAVTLLAGLAVAGCTTASATPSASRSEPSAVAPSVEPTIGTFELTSTAFVEAGQIPIKYTCQGDRVSPPLAWSGAPAAARAFVLIEEDETNAFTHWVMVNIPGSSDGSLREGISRSPDAPKQLAPYVPMCPQVGASGYYVFTLYALSAPLAAADLPHSTDATLVQIRVEKAMTGHVLAEATLAASYTGT